jgi:DNA-binding NarL/FixJ family response regulator
MTAIVIADDHPMVRHGMRTVLEAEPGWSVVGEAADGPAALALIAALQPDVVLIDLMMPGLNGIEVTRALQTESPHTKVLVFSMHADDAYVRAALASGAMGYILKDTEASEIVTLVRTVLAGGRVLSRALTERAVDAYLQPSSDPSLHWAEMLTNRERQVLQLVAEGLSNTAIADRLQISPRTAETHRANLTRKLGLTSQADLLRYAFEHGLIKQSP